MNCEIIQCPNCFTCNPEFSTLCIRCGSVLPNSAVATEHDPNGLKQGESGAKFDAGKIRVSLLKRFGLALLAVADLATGGAEKYTPHGWSEVENGIERYDDAMFGHYLREMFEDIDPDMKVRHEVSTAWNALARLQLLIEDDPKWKERLMKREATRR